MKALVFGLLALIFLKVVLIAKASRALSLKELRRRARSGHDKRAKALYQLAAFNSSLELVFWLVGSLSAAGLVILAANAAWWLGLWLALAIGWLVMRSHVQPDSWVWKIAALAAIPASKFLSLMQPLLRAPATWLDKRSREPHTKIYEKQDLIELLEKQNRQLDNRFSKEEINIIRGALSFDGKTVGSVMTPRKLVRLAAASDSIGPMLMDELHKSGLSRFPVVKEIKKTATPEIIGTLYLKDLMDHADKGKVRDVMKKSVHFINEQQNLRQGLAVLLSTQDHLLIVINNFEEFVGVLAIEDVVAQILGQKITDEFDQHDDSRAVAAQEEVGATGDSSDAAT